MSIELVTAEPIPQHGAAFARYAEAASDGLFRLMIGGAAERVLAKAFTETGHDMSYEHVTFAVLDDEPVGMVSAYLGSTHHGADDKILVRAAGWRAARMGLLALAAWRLFEFMSALEPADYYIQAIAVDPDRRGHGIGGRLLNHAESRARSGGATRMALDVDVKNPRAQQLYERIGYSVEATSPRALVLGNSQVRRMVKPL